MTLMIQILHYLYENTTNQLTTTITETINEDNLSRDDYITLQIFRTNNNNEIPTINRYEVLMTDSLENEQENGNVHNQPSRKTNPVERKRPNVVVNEMPENDTASYTEPRLVPGDASYANISSQDHKRNKILLLADSTLSRIQMRKLNFEIKSGKAYCKYFPGTTPTEIAHYCLPTLRTDKPDAVVIHAGTNSLFKDDTQDIANEVFNFIKICRNHGVIEIFASGITYRKQYLTKVRELNKHIESMKLTLDFKFINNENIFASDIGNDNIHLNPSGTVKIANNIINAINTLHIT